MSDQVNIMTSDAILPAWFDADKHIVARNGVIIDREKGRIVGGKPSNVITHETSAAYHRARKEKMQAAARAAIARSANTRNSIEGLAYGIESLFTRAISGEEDLDKSRKAILTAGKVAGLIDDARQTLDNTGTNDSVSVGALSELKGILELFLNAAQNGEK